MPDADGHGSDRGVWEHRTISIPTTKEVATEHTLDRHNDRGGPAPLQRHRSPLCTRLP